MTRWIGHPARGGGRCPGQAGPLQLSLSRYWRGGRLATLAPPPITADRAPTHLSIVLGGGERLIYEGNGSANLAISPDGRRIVYVAEKAGVRQVYARNLGQSESQPIAGTEGANTRLPFFAPDGQWVGFFGGGLRKVPVAGGQAVLVTPVGSNSDTGSAQWLDDGSIVFSNGMGTTLRRVSATGGPVTEITKFDGAESWWGHLWPDVLPGNRHVLFTIVPPDDDIERTIVVVQSLETGERRELLRGARFARYRFGHLVYERRGQYFAVPFDPASLAVGSKATVVLDKTWWGRMAVSTLGAMVYRPGGDSALQGLVWVDRSGREESVTGPPLLLAGEVALSPDGKTAAVAAGDLNHFLWLVDTTRGTARRLTSDLHSHDPVWMPDGQSMIFTGNKAGVRQNLRRLWLDRRDESEPGALRAQDDVLQSGATVHPDGHTVAFVSGATPPFDIYTFDLNRTDRPRPLLATRVSEAGPSFSPNGRWLAYTSDESGRTEVYVARWPDLGGQQFVSTEGGAEPLWSKDGRELAYRWAGVVHAVSFDPARGTVGTPERLFAGYPQLNAFQGIDLAPDGRFIVTKQAPSADTSLHVVLNWDIELRRLTKQ